MKISDIGGEFALIRRLSQIAGLNHSQLIQGIGDDAAVMEMAPGSYLLATADTMVADRHFDRRWATPEQIGSKAGESNVSDIAAMGGIPDWMIVALTLPGDIEVDWVDGLYRGLAQCCRRHGVAVVGGDITEGPAVVISITLLGHVHAEDLCLRSHARIGDIVAVTGPLGSSAAALALLNQGHRPSAYLLDKHLNPRCRMDIAGRISPLAHAMIDISDGLAAEALHICEQSRVGVELETDKIRLHPDVAAAGNVLGCAPLQWALGGGEDYELLFTIAADNWEALKKRGIDCYEVGKITADDAVLITPDGRRQALTGGFDHFGKISRPD